MDGKGAGEAPVLLAAPDKFRGTASAGEVAAAIARGASPWGWAVHQMPLADGGEGLLDALDEFGGSRRSVEVTGPLGRPVVAEWLQLGQVAVIEMARASGLQLVGGAAGNEAVFATSRGTGELMVAAARTLAGSKDGADLTMVVGLGGSATTDGGQGAVEAIEEAGGLGAVELVGACDVEVAFADAAPRFGPQKGADPAQVVLLGERLEAVAKAYQRRYGVDVRPVPGTGAAGGFGGAIVALGGVLRSGYEVVTQRLGFADQLRSSRLVVTGEGSFDGTSLLGKVVGSVLRDAASAGVPVLVVAGQVDPEVADSVRNRGAVVQSLSERFGKQRAVGDTLWCIEQVVAEHVGGAMPI